MAQCPDTGSCRWNSCTHLEYTNSVFAHVPAWGIWACIIYRNTWVKPMSYLKVSGESWKDGSARAGQRCKIKGEAGVTSWYKIQGGPGRKMNEKWSLQSWDKQVCSKGDGDEIWYILLLALKGQIGHWVRRYVYRTWELPSISWICSWC